MPTVSVIVATYRHDDMLQRALESLALQTYKDFEIILVDDNSDDAWNRKVSDIVYAFSSKYPDVQIELIVNSDNLGSAETRNVGIRCSKGKYITFLDDDDIYLPKKLEHQLSTFIKEDADYGITDLYLYNNNDKLIDKRIRNYITSYSKDALLKYHLMFHLTGTDTLMFKKEYLDSINGFDPIDVGDEFYLMQKAIMAGGKFCYSPHCYVKAYVHSGHGGLSSGEGKIRGEVSLYGYKKQFFNALDKRSINYINTRHFAVLAYAYLRMKKYRSFIKYSFKGFFTSPISFCKILFSR